MTGESVLFRLALVRMDLEVRLVVRGHLADGVTSRVLETEVKKGYKDVEQAGLEQFFRDRAKICDVHCRPILFVHLFTHSGTWPRSPCGT